MKTDIQETIDHLRILDKNISPAPWEITHSRHLETMEGVGLAIEDSEGETVAEADADFEHHSLFINDALPLMVELRNAIPLLLTEIERLSNELRGAEGRLGRVASSHPEAYLTALGGDEE